MTNTTKHIVITLAILATSFGAYSCNKKQAETTGAPDIYTCYLTQHLSQSGLAHNLADTWKWKSRTCETTGLVAADKYITVNFSKEGSFMVAYNKAIVATGTWTLKKIDGEFYALDLSNESEYLYGRIIICGDQLMFNNSYIDGCDNMFERV